MFNTRSKITYCCISLLLTACVHSENKNLGNGYTLILDGPNYLTGKIELPEEVDSVFYNDRYILMHQIPSKNGYLAHIKRNSLFLYNSFFLQPRDKTTHTGKDSFLVTYLSSRGFKGDNQDNDIMILDKLADSLIQHDSYYRDILDKKEVYWLIDKSKNILHGPFNKEYFYDKKKELHIDEQMIYFK